MGCLRNIIKLVVISFAVIGFLAVGGREFLRDHVAPVIRNFNENFNNEITNRDKSVGNMSINELKEVVIKSGKKTFSENSVADKNYEITKIKGIWGCDGEMVIDKESGQRMITVETKNKVKINLNQTDKTALKTDMLKFAKKHKNIPLKFDDLDVVEQGIWNIYGNNQNYVTIKFKDKISEKYIEAMISPADEDNSKMYITFAPVENFSPKIALEYWK